MYNFTSSFSFLLLSLINMCTMWDRYSTAGVLRSIEEYYNINDATGGLLQTTFVIVYILSSLILIYLGDRFNRRLLILITGWIWLIFVSLSGFIPCNLFYVFLSLRSLAAIADATIIIIAPSIIADLYNGKARTYALTIFYMFISVGISVGLVVGTFLTEMNTEWQWSVRCVPFLGVPVMILSTIFLKDPIREKDSNNNEESNIIYHLKKILNIKTYWFTVASLACFNFLNRANSWWQTTLLQEAIIATNETDAYHGINLPQIQSIISIAGIVSGLLIAPAIVYLANRWKEGLFPFCISSSRSIQFIAAIGSAISIPFGILYVWGAVIDVYIVIIGAIISGICNAALIPLGLDTILNVIPSIHRGSACALLYLIQSATGDGPAPFIIGWISDSIRNGQTDDASHYYSLATGMYIAFGIGIGTSVFMFIASYFYPKDSLENRDRIREEYEDMSERNTL